jgi:hypothetical protein
MGRRSAGGVVRGRWWGGKERHTPNATHAGLLWLLSDGEVVFSGVVGHEYGDVIRHGRKGVGPGGGWGEPGWYTYSLSLS